MGYSRAVRAGPWVFVAGTTGTADGTVVAPGDAYAQAVLALANIEAALALAGAELADVVQTRLSVTDISYWEEVGRAHREAFGHAPPVTALIEVSGLIDPDMLVEIEAVAYLETPAAASTARAQHRGTHRRHSPLPLPDALGPTPGQAGRFPLQHLAGGTAVEGQGGPHAHDGAQPVGRLQRGHTDSGVALPHVELGALTSLVPQGFERGAGHVNQGQTVTGCPSQRHQAQAQGEAAAFVPSDETVVLQGNGQAVSSGTGQPRGRDEVGQGQRTRFEGGQHADALVEDAYTAYT